MSITQIRHAVTELLSAVDIAEPDILVGLEDLLATQVFHSPIQLKAALLNSALCAQIDRVEKFETECADYNQNLLVPTRMKSGWRPRELLVPKMMAVFEKTRIEIGYIRETFIAECLASQKIWSRSWDEEFLRFALKSWWTHLLQSKQETTELVKQSARSKTTEQIPASVDVAAVIRQLRDQFTSWKRRLWRSWQPSLGAARRLERLGVPRDVTYNPLFVSGFINNVNAGKYPFKEFDFNYIRYVLDSRKQIERIENENATKRNLKSQVSS